MLQEWLLNSSGTSKNFFFARCARKEGIITHIYVIWGGGARHMPGFGLTFGYFHQNSLNFLDFSLFLAIFLQKNREKMKNLWQIQVIGCPGPYLRTRNTFLMCFAAFGLGRCPHWTSGPNFWGFGWVGGIFGWLGVLCWGLDIVYYFENSKKIHFSEHPPNPERSENIRKRSETTLHVFSLGKLKTEGP